MTRHNTERLTVYTNNGSATYRTRSKAFAAARWVAGGSGETVEVANEATGERWDVSPTNTRHSIQPT
jgi:hypothetical protein